MINREIKQYLRHIARVLPCSNKQNKQYLSDLNYSINNYLLEYPYATKETLLLHFGTPQDIADSFHQAQDGLEVVRTVKKNRTIKKINISVAFVILASIIAFSFLYINDFFEDSSGKYSETITVTDKRAPIVSIYQSDINNDHVFFKKVRDQIVSKTLSYFGDSGCLIWKVTVTADVLWKKDTGFDVRNLKFTSYPLNSNYIIKRKSKAINKNSIDVIITITKGLRTEEKLIRINCNEKGIFS